MATITSSANGSCNSGSTWNGTIQSGEFIEINHAVTLSVSTATVGNVNINDGGSLTIQNNGTLNVSGIVYVDGGSTGSTLEMEAGSKLQFYDSASKYSGLWIENNTCAHNNDEGIFVDNASNGGLFLNNKCLNNVWGITNQFSHGNTYRYNNCTSNGYTGYGLYYSDWLVIENNTLMFNGAYGFQILSSQNGLIMYNDVKNTTNYAVYLETNIITFVLHHNNFLGNNIGGTSQALDDDITGSPFVTWYDTATNEGNFWDDYSGTGNYSIDGTANNYDPYPLNAEVVIITEFSYLVFGLILLTFIGIVTIFLKKR